MSKVREGKEGTGAQTLKRAPNAQTPFVPRGHGVWGCRVGCFWRLVVGSTIGASVGNDNALPSFFLMMEWKSFPIGCSVRSCSWPALTRRRYCIYALVVGFVLCMYVCASQILRTKPRLLLWTVQVSFTGVILGFGASLPACLSALRFIVHDSDSLEKEAIF